jgi:2-polyprenyl-3-methyl-5-hydroxy-6-metoxy-1,4-benzoquinol methylase
MNERTKLHYENHLAGYYSWMCGDFDQAKTRFQKMLERNGIFPSHTKLALDLGAGHGIQSVAMSDMGYHVTAIDFSEQLLQQLKARDASHAIGAIKEDIRNFRKHLDIHAELIVCCGDTLTHLETKDQVNNLIKDCSEVLVKNGWLVLSYRDYSVDLNEQRKFIPVKSDQDRILTCILEYETDKVVVTDLVHEKAGEMWNLNASWYKKLRISPFEVNEQIQRCGLVITFNEVVGGMTTVIAKKKLT